MIKSKQTSIAVDYLSKYSNECPHDDKPSSGMFAVSDDVFSALSSSRGSVVS